MTFEQLGLHRADGADAIHSRLEQAQIQREDRRLRLASDDRDGLVELSREPRFTMPWYPVYRLGVFLDLAGHDAGGLIRQPFLQEALAVEGAFDGKVFEPVSPEVLDRTFIQLALRRQSLGGEWNIAFCLRFLQFGQATRIAGIFPMLGGVEGEGNPLQRAAHLELLLNLAKTGGADRQVQCCQGPCHQPVSGFRVSVAWLHLHCCSFINSQYFSSMVMPGSSSVRKGEAGSPAPLYRLHVGLSAQA